MRSRPRFSIIVPVYDDATDLARCLRALRQVDLIDKAEVIVVDDASPGDESVLRETSARFDARYHHREKNQGAGTARNLGANLAEGDILAFIDADCVAPRDWLAQLTAPIRKDTYQTTTSCYLGPVNRTWLTIFQDEDYRYRMPGEESNTYFVNSCNLAMTRQVFRDVSGFPPIVLAKT